MKNPYVTSASQSAKKPDVAQDIDLISFDRRKRAEEIRKSEEQAVLRRQREIIARRRAEYMRRVRIERIKALSLLAIIGIGIIAAIIGIISVIIKSAVGKDTDVTKGPETVSEAESALITEFSTFDGSVFSKDIEFLSNVDAFLTDKQSLNTPSSTVLTNEFGFLAQSLSLKSNSKEFDEFKTVVKNVPMINNGYIWSETGNRKFSLTDSYMYDTNSSFISAVSKICLAEGSFSFLYETDTDAMPNADRSQGKTVREKLEAAVNYFFDGKTYDGGAKYDKNTKLVYIHTASNSGLSTGLPSNRFFNFRFGYLDAYTNISFNRAMRDLAELYKFMGEDESAEKYNKIADEHTTAFNEKFWDANKQRYIGCFDSAGKSYDYGFVFLNLEAIDAGIADNEKAEAILSWIDGERIIETDTSTGEDIFAYGFAPRNTTVEAQDKWWDYLDGKLPVSGDGAYDLYYQNGGTSLSTAYFNISARLKTGDTEGAAKAVDSLISYTASDSIKEYTENPKFDNNSAANRLAYLGVIKEVFGIKTDGTRLFVSPNVMQHITQASSEKTSLTYGIKGLDFAGNTYSFLFENDSVYITADTKKAVRLTIGGFEPQAEYTFTSVNENVISDTAPIMSTENGDIEITAEFGGTNYIKIEKMSK